MRLMADAHPGDAISERRQKAGVIPELRVLEGLAQAAEDAARRGGSCVTSGEVLDCLRHRRDDLYRNPLSPGGRHFRDSRHTSIGVAP